MDVFVNGVQTGSTSRRITSKFEQKQRKRHSSEAPPLYAPFHWLSPNNVTELGGKLTQKTSIRFKVEQLVPVNLPSQVLLDNFLNYLKRNRSQTHFLRRL